MKRTPLILLGLAALTACGSPLSTEDRTALAFDGIRIGVCQEKGRECKRSGGRDCWDAYDSCITASGLRDGGAK